MAYYNETATAPGYANIGGNDVANMAKQQAYAQEVACDRKPSELDMICNRLGLASIS